jgi:hypothetical protein
MNLAHYLGSGIIVPSIYIENKNVDIQDGFKNYLLLSSSKFTRDTNCAIEIVLNSEEGAPQKISENFYLFDKPLPISRIKGIHFTNEEKKISSNFDITSGTAFIPEGLLKVSTEESIDTKELENIEYKPSEKNWTNFLKRYDQILGGFSTMRISKEKFQNYPTHYFSTLSNINDLFANILDKQNISIENSFQFAFTNEGKFKDFHNTIYSEIDYNEVRHYAEKDNVKLEVKNGIVQIDRIPENKQTYLVAILDSYGKGKRKQVDSFISDLISGKFSESKKEGLSLIFGLNKGYKAFRNKYKTQNFEVDIKFRLDSKLDYYIIESIYQRVFNSTNNISAFKYIDDFLAGNKQEENKTSNYVTYQMIDKTIIWKQKVLSPLEKLLTKIAQKVHSWFPSFVEVKKNEIESLFKEEIEFFKNEIETDLEKKFKVELEQSISKIEELKTTISKNEKLINQLENQLAENSQSKSKNEETVKTESESSKAEILNVEPDKNTNGKLFSNETSIPANKLREVELDKKKMPALKALAENYQIQKSNSLRKPELIAEIIKYESKQ